MNKNKKQNVEFAAPPKLSAKKIIYYNFLLLKLVFSASPGAFALYAFEQFRVSAFIFVEHTWLVKTVLDCVQYGKPFKDALVPIVSVAALLLVTSVFGSLTNQWLVPKATLKAQTKLKNLLFEKAHEVDLKYFDDPEYYNDFIMTTGKTASLVDYSFKVLYTLSSSLGTIVTTGVYFLTVSFSSFLIVMVAAAINLFLILKRNKYTYSKYVTSQKYVRRTEYIKRFFYLPDFAKELRLASDVKDTVLSDFDKTYEDICNNATAHNRKILAVENMKCIIETFLFSFVFVVYLAYRASVKETISYATMIVMMNSCYSLRGSLHWIIVRLSGSAENCMYIEKIKEFLGKKAEIVSEKGETVSKEPCSLELKNVSFRYNDTDGDVIKNVSIKLHPREKIALVGYNGAGKTTLIKLIMRLYDPTSGEILLDGKNIKNYDVEKYRHNIGVVFQDFNLYAATVKENVVMGPADEAEPEKVRSSLIHSGFEDKLENLKNDIDTQLTTEFDDDGVNLSGGESQKIAIARAFYKNSGLIILDEPSSALDPIAEYNFNKYMSQAAKDCTVIFISHRLSTTRLADRIFVMENGAVCESGSHDELLCKGGVYSDMWHAQADKYTL